MWHGVRLCALWDFGLWGLCLRGLVEGLHRLLPVKVSRPDCGSVVKRCHTTIIDIDFM